MKKTICLLLILGATAFSRAFADDTNKPAVSCDPAISIRLKEPEKEIKTNESVVVVIQIKNLSTNETLIFRTENVPTDFTWAITSPSGKDVSLKPDLFPVAISGSFPKLKPLGSKEIDYDLNRVCNFNEVGIYKVVVKKEVFSISPERKKYEIISDQLSIVVSQ